MSPDWVLTIEIREHAYLYGPQSPGPYGLPVGSSGKGVLLLSGGIDSPVAGWMMAKRGMALEAVYFHSPPFTSEKAREKVGDAGPHAFAAGRPGIILHVVNRSPGARPHQGEGQGRGSDAAPAGLHDALRHAAGRTRGASAW